MIPKQQRSVETRNRILSTAKTSFAEHGYEATGVAEICQSAGVSKGSFYHHFSSKQEVFLELLHRWLENTDQQLTSLRESNTNIPETLSSMAVVPQHILGAADQHLPIYLEFLTQAVREPQIRQAAIEPYHRYSDFFAEIIQAGVEEGSLQTMDPQVAARVMISFAVGVLLQGLLDPNGADWDQVTQEGVRILLNGWSTR